MAKGTKSTKPYRDVQRATAMSEVLSGAISKVSPTAQIPIKFSQALMSGFSFFNQDLKPQERLVQGTQWLISTIQVTLLIALFITGKEAIVAFSLLARLIILTEMLYQGVLLVGWAPSELSKETDDTTTTPALAAPKAATQPTTTPAPLLKNEVQELANSTGAPKPF